MDVGQRIKSRRKELKMSADEVAEKIGVSRSTVFRYESGDIEKVSIEMLTPLSKALKVSPAYFMGWDEQNDISTIYNQLEEPRQYKVYSFAERQLEEQNNTKVVHLHGITAAGEPIEYIEGYHEEREVQSVPKGADVALLVKGDSMEPTYKDGSIIFYKSQPSVENGELAVVEIDGAVTFKKVRFDYENERIVLQSLNEKYDDRVLEANEVKILGKVLN